MHETTGTVINSIHCRLHAPDRFALTIHKLIPIFAPKLKALLWNYTSTQPT